MRFDCDKWKRARAARALAQEQWHPWFAWRPVRIKDGLCVWMEAIERRVVWRRTCDWIYKRRYYRIKES